MCLLFCSNMTGYTPIMDNSGFSNKVFYLVINSGDGLYNNLFFAHFSSLTTNDGFFYFK